MISKAPEPVRLIGYHVASLGNGEDGKTIGGWMFMLVSTCEGKREMFCPLNWRSKTLRRVVKSTFAGETLACSACLDGIFLMTNLVFEIAGCNI